MIGKRVFVTLLRYPDDTWDEDLFITITQPGGKGLWWGRTDAGRLGWIYEEDIVELVNG